MLYHIHFLYNAPVNRPKEQLIYSYKLPSGREGLFLYLSLERGIFYSAIGHSLMGTERNELHNESKRMNLPREFAMG
jgi:hypothetical protein